MEFVIGFFVMGMMYEPAATYNQRTVCFSPEMNNSLDQQFNVSFMYKPLQ